MFNDNIYGHFNVCLLEFEVFGNKTCRLSAGLSTQQKISASQLEIVSVTLKSDQISHLDYVNVIWLLPTEDGDFRSFYQVFSTKDRIVSGETIKLTNRICRQSIRIPRGSLNYLFAKCPEVKGYAEDASKNLRFQRVISPAKIVVECRRSPKFWRDLYQSLGHYFNSLIYPNNLG